MAASTLLADLVVTSQRVADDSGRRAKIAHIAEFLRRLAAAEIGIGVAYLAGAIRQGRSGIGWALIRDAQAAAGTDAESPTLTLVEVDAALDEVAHASGPGSIRERTRLLSALFARATAAEHEFLARLARIPIAALEWKIDGARVQVHKQGEEVRIYSRTGNDVTVAAPELVSIVRNARARNVILDGEAIALKASGAPYPFQDTMRRFGRQLDVEAMRTTMPLSVFFFDCLRRDDRDLVPLPSAERFAALTDALSPNLLIPRLVTSDIAAAQAFYDDALERGHEGVMVKALDAPYDPGARSAQWLKVKRAHTLDLVVLAAEWGHGRRRGRLSNLHLGALDPASGEFVMLGKTFKGLTDATLAWQTEELLKREVTRDEWTVRVRPELVVEIAFNDLQASPRYPGGLALRFARVKGYRPDKNAREADTIETVREIYAKQDK